MATTDSDLGIIEEPDADLGIKEDTSVPSAQYAEGERRMKEAEEKYKEPPEIGPFSAAAAKFAEGYVPGFKQMYAFVNKGDKPYAQALKETEELTQRVGKEQPIVSGVAKTVGAVAPYVAAAPAAATLGLAGSVSVPAAIGATQGFGQTAFTGAPASEVALETAKGGALGALISGLFKGAGVVSRSLAPTAESTAITSALRRTGQTAIKSTVPVGLAAKPAYTTFLDDAATPEDRAAAATELVAMGLLPPAIELYKGAQRSALRKTKPMADRAAREGRDLIAEEQRVAGDKAIAEQAQGEARAEAERAKAAESAISEQRASENRQYKTEIDRLTQAEIENRKAAEVVQDLKQKTQLEQEVAQDRQARAQLEAKIANNISADREITRRMAEDDQLSFAQRQGMLQEEKTIWDAKNKRAFQGIKEEQRVMSDAKRLAAQDQSAVAELRQELAAVRALEERLQTDADPSLQGMVAKKFQDMYNRLNTAMQIMRTGGQDIPQAYQDTFETISESYRRNTEKGGYVGFGPDTELFIEDPIQWKERKKAEMLAKAQAEGGVLDQRISDALDAIANNDYLSDARARAQKPNVPPERLAEIFADQDLQYNGKDLFNKDGTRIPQPLMGGRIPDAPFTSAERLESDIQRRQAMRDLNENIRKRRAAEKAALSPVQTMEQRQRALRIAELEARAPSTGIRSREEIRAQMEAMKPMPAGMSEADILAARGVPAAPAPAMTPADVLAREGITPEAARREFEARAAAGRREVEYGTPAPDADTLRLLNLESVPRAVFETMTPEKLRLFSRIRGSGALLGGSVVEKQTPSVMSERSALDPRQSRLQSPFQALAVQDAFTKTLERSLQNQNAWVRFVQTAGKFASIPEFLKQNPDIAKEVSDELAAGTEYTSTVRARRPPPENK